MAKISEYPALAAWTGSVQIPAYDPTDSPAPDKHVTLDMIRNVGVGQVASPAPAVLSSLKGDNGSATANSGNSYAVAINKMVGVITTDGLTTAAGAARTITVTDSQVDAADMILISRNGGTSAGGTPVLKAVPGAGSFVITIDNKHASAAFDGTFVLAFLVVKALT